MTNIKPDPGFLVLILVLFVLVAGGVVVTKFLGQETNSLETPYYGQDQATLPMPEELRKHLVTVCIGGHEYYYGLWTGLYSVAVLAPKFDIMSKVAMPVRCKAKDQLVGPKKEE